MCRALSESLLSADFSAAMIIPLFQRCQSQSVKLDHMRERTIHRIVHDLDHVIQGDLTVPPCFISGFSQDPPLGLFVLLFQPVSARVLVVMRPGFDRHDRAAAVRVIREVLTPVIDRALKHQTGQAGRFMVCDADPARDRRLLCLLLLRSPEHLLRQGAQIDAFGVGERLITSKSDPVFGGVYKLVAVEEEEGNITPKIKISENPQKITTPHFKKLYRLYNNENGKAEADLICVHDEEVDDSKPIEIFDPHYTWKRKTLENVTAVPLQQHIFDKGRQVYSVPDIEESRRLCASQLESMWKEVLRWENPHDYYVDLSESLWEIKDSLLRKLRNKS